MLMIRVCDDREYLGCLIDRYEEKLRRYLRRFMPSLREEEDDVLQEIFLKVFTHARAFDSALSFSSWVYRIAHNEAVSWLRRQNKRAQTYTYDEEEIALFRESILQAMQKEEYMVTNDEVQRVLYALPAHYRSVLVLFFLEGKTYEEISDILTIPVGTVGTYMHRAKKAFSTIYARHHEQ